MTNETAEHYDLPVFIRRAIKWRNFVRIRVYIHHTRSALIRTQNHLIELRLPVLRLGHGINRYDAQVAGLLQMTRSIAVPLAYPACSCRWLGASPANPDAG